MNITKSGVLMLLVCTICFSSLSAQKKKKGTTPVTFNTTETYLIKLKDESTFTGQYVERTDSTVVFTAKSSRLVISKDDIESAKVIDPSRFVNGKYWFANPHHTRYLFSPSAYNLKKGEGYYQNIYATVQSFNYGLSDHFSLGGGTELISLFSGYPLIMVTPKFGGYRVSDNWQAGGGVLFVGGFNDDFNGGAGIGYGIATAGNEDRNITFGLGWAFSTEGDVESKPVATISGMYRFSKNIAFVSENWLIPFDGYEPFFSYGLRFFGEKIAVDIALINSPDIATEVIAIGFPYVDFVYKF